VSYTPLSGDTLQYLQDNVAASGYYIKLYASGTTTPISIATDSTGGTLLAKAEINAQGRVINGSSAVFIPHIDQKYKFVLYANDTDADANTFANAIYNIDAIEPFATVATGAENVKNFATLAAAVTDTGLVDGDALNIAERTTGNGGGAMWDVVLSSTVTENTYNIVQCTGVGTLSLVLRFDTVLDMSQAGLLSDGTSETVFFQTMLDLAPGKKLITPNQGGTINIGQIVIPSNTDWDIMPGVIIEDDGTLEGTTDRLFRIFRVSDVKINAYGATLQGLGAGNYTGEQNHGVYCVGSQNVHIFGLSSDSTGGDGFYFGSSGGTGDQLWAEDCALIDCIAPSNRRQGLTINSVKNFVADRFGGTLTDGASPEAGIDIEPNDNGEFLQNVVIRDSFTGANEGAGITVGIKNLAGVTDKIIDITIENHTDNGSETGLSVAAFDGTAGTVNGRITVKDFRSNDSVNGSFNIRNYGSDGPLLELIRPHSHNSTTSAGTSPKSHSPFSIFREAGDTGSTRLGNIKIIDPLITTDGTPQTIAAFYANDLTTAVPDEEIEKTYIINPVGIGGISAINALDIRGAIQIDDSYGLFASAQDADFTISSSAYYTSVGNENESDSIQRVTLDASISVGAPTITFECKQSGSRMRIIPDGASTINPFGTGAGKYLESDVLGEKITIRRTSTTTWDVISVVGSWDAEP